MVDFKKMSVLLLLFLGLLFLRGIVASGASNQAEGPDKITFYAPPPPPLPEAVFFKKGMTKPVRVLGNDPEYPSEVSAAGIEGKVVTILTISSTGEVIDVQIVKSVPRLDETVVQTVKQWKFKPALDENGHPIAIKMKFDFVFKLIPTSTNGITFEPPPPLSPPFGSSETKDTSPLPPPPPDSNNVARGFSYLELWYYMGLFDKLTVISFVYMSLIFLFFIIERWISYIIIKQEMTKYTTNIQEQELRSNSKRVIKT